MSAGAEAGASDTQGRARQPAPWGFWAPLAIALLANVAAVMLATALFMFLFTAPGESLPDQQHFHQ